MIERTYKIISEQGIHARVASDLVRIASKYECDIKLILENVEVDFKSIMGVMSLGIYKDEIVKIICNGIDENEAISNLEMMISELKLAKEY